MEPRTRTEKEVAKLSKKLGSIGIRDERKLLDNTYGKRSYDEMFSRCYAVINQSYQGWQVMRYFRISRRGKRNIRYSIWEVLQVWSKQGERQTIVSRRRCQGFYIDTFSLSSDMEIRRPSMYQGNWMDIPYEYIYNKSIGGIFAEIEHVFADEYNWVEGVNMNRRNMYRAIAETSFPDNFIKVQPSLFARVSKYESTYRRSEEYLAAYKIATRHHYKIKSLDVYLDYLEALVYLGKDTHNPFYVCPQDLKGMHDKWIAKMLAKKTAEDIRCRAKENAEANEKYIKMRERFFDMVISDGEIECRVLQSVSDFCEEGQAMHNCVYANGYYKKPYSLIFSARIDGKRVETVEFDLTSGKVIQAYGKCNIFSAHHEQIVKLVNDNAGLINSYYKNNNNLKIAI